MTDIPGPDQPPREPRGRRGLLEAVAEQLAEMTGDVAKLKTNTRGNAELLSEALPRLQGLEESVATLTVRVDVLAEVDEDDTGRSDPAVLDALGLAAKPGIPWCWPAMDARTAHAAWVQLARFVGEVLCAQHVVTRTQLPDCWPAHPHAVDTLSWLRATYRTARVGKAPAAAAAEWTTRWFPGAWKAIADGMGQECVSGWHLVDQTIRNAFEHVRQRETNPPASGAQGGMFRFEGEPAEVIARQQDIVRRVLGETSPRRPRVMNVDELVERDAHAAAATQRSHPHFWLQIWRAVAAADASDRASGSSSTDRYDL